MSTRQAPDQDSGLADLLSELSRRLFRAQRAWMEPMGVTPAQARLLRAVASNTGDRPPRMADLARRLDVVPRAITSLVDALEACAAVRRLPDPDNRRVIRIELTEVGNRLLDELRAARRAAATDILAPLDDRGRRQLGEILKVLAGGTGGRCGSTADTGGPGPVTSPER